MKRQRSILCGLIISLSLAACTAIGPTATEVPTATEAPTATPRVIVEGEVETLLGCVDLLTISLDGAEPQDYELSLTFPAGEVASVRCVDGQTEEGWVYGMPFTHYWDYIFCSNYDGRDYVSYNGAPSSFTVTLTWDDSQIVQHYEPTYKAFMGECHVGGITVTRPVSP